MTHSENTERKAALRISRHPDPERDQHVARSQRHVGYLHPVTDASRRSEHVACAGGAPVLSAGEITFLYDQGRWMVSKVSNQSTGYCPDPASWPAVSDALDRAGLQHPGHFTDPIVFRRCPRCQERNLVKDDYFVCAICGAELPPTWNLDPLEEHQPCRS
jgi:hypothetical protein